LEAFPFRCEIVALKIQYTNVRIYSCGYSLRIALSSLALGTGRTPITKSDSKVAQKKDGNRKLTYLTNDE